MFPEYYKSTRIWIESFGVSIECKLFPEDWWCFYVEEAGAELRRAIQVTLLIKLTLTLLWDSLEIIPVLYKTQGILQKPSIIISSIAFRSHFPSPNDHHNIHIVETFKLIISIEVWTIQINNFPCCPHPPSSPHMMIIRITAAWPHSALHRINSRCEGRHACK